MSFFYFGYKFKIIFWRGAGCEGVARGGGGGSVEGGFGWLVVWG